MELLAVECGHGRLRMFNEYQGGVADGSMMSTPRTQWDARESVLCLRSIHTPLNKSWRAGGLHTEGRAIESLPVSSGV